VCVYMVVLCMQVWWKGIRSWVGWIVRAAWRWMWLKEFLLCWRGCMSCLKVKTSGSITVENLCPLHSHVFCNKSKLWVCRLCSSGWCIHSCDMILYHWIIGFWCFKTTQWSHLQGSKYRRRTFGRFDPWNEIAILSQNVRNKLPGDVVSYPRTSTWVWSQ